MTTDVSLDILSTETAEYDAAVTEVREANAKRRPGRPKGSKNGTSTARPNRPEVLGVDGDSIGTDFVGLYFRLVGDVDIYYNGDGIPRACWPNNSGPYCADVLLEALKVVRQFPVINRENAEAVAKSFKLDLENTFKVWEYGKNL